jgi:hypothetical protein
MNTIKLLKKAILILIFLLILFLILTGCTNKTVETLNSGIYGIITLGPISPVQKEGEINYKPYKATVIVNSTNGTKITEFISNDDGSFKVYLKPGSYILESQKTSNIYPILKPITVVVKENQFTEVNISFDSGIR